MPETFPKLKLFLLLLTYEALLPVILVLFKISELFTESKVAAFVPKLLFKALSVLLFDLLEALFACSKTLFKLFLLLFKAIALLFTSLLDFQLLSWHYLNDYYYHYY